LRRPTTLLRPNAPFLPRRPRLHLLAVERPGLRPLLILAATWEVKL
jgi:hypothetical protein